ncbi:hypothetical protein [Streptomyces sp. NPDC005336]|uniref:hypothetical protein n=1 Tax=Streptomyces sp. NPDC005336 TaxID=3157035 RepID=UPI0033B75B56
MLTGAEKIDRALLEDIVINEHAQSTYENNRPYEDPNPPTPGDIHNPDDEDGEAAAS